MHLSLISQALWLAQLLSVLCARHNFLTRREPQGATAEPATGASPIQVTASAFWDGYDGPWSSFTIGVGTPAQALRVLVSTSSQGTVVVLPSGCVSGDTICPIARGGLFNNSSSQSWSEIESTIYLFQDPSLTALLGNDTLTLEVAGNTGPNLTNQVIFGIADDKKYYLGMLGLSQVSTSLSKSEKGQPSFITSLRDQSKIPSLSFGYTAGAKYRFKEVLGSLTLGGYDQSRFTPNNLTFSFEPGTTDLVVGIQSIVSTNANGTSNSLLSSGILAYVDSTVSGLTLPIEICQSFEKAFGLKYNPTNGFYLVDAALHTTLVAQNASVTFTLGSTTTGGKTINITLPYESFDLQLSPPVPLISNNTGYFPLQRAVNTTRYVLGRTFLQEAYLIVDWERSNFSLSQCLFIENAPAQILAINPPSATSSSKTTTPKSSSSNKKTIGIGVGVSISVLFVAGLAFCLYLRRKKPSKAVGPNSVHSPEVQPIPSSPPVDSKELDAEKTAIHELYGSHRHGQHGQASSLAQVSSWALQHGDRSQGVEFITNQGGPGLSSSEPLLDSVHEVHGSQTTPYELAADIRSEMPSDPVTRKVSSGGASSLKRRSRSFFGFGSSRSSTYGSVPTPGSPASAAGGQTTTTSNGQSMTNSPPQESELFSSISPIVEGETAGPAGLNTALIRGFSQSSRSSRRIQNVPQERLNGDTGAI